jgi:hypothetical protein
MNLKNARDKGKLSKVAYTFGMPFFIIGVVLDALINITLMTILFLELPKEILVTSRLKRHIYTSTGYREKIAVWFCSNLLNPFDPDGSHC